MTYSLGIESKWSVNMETDRNCLMCPIIGIISVYLSPCVADTVEVITASETRPCLM